MTFCNKNDKWDWILKSSEGLAHHHLLHLRHDLLRRLLLLLPDHLLHGKVLGGLLVRRGRIDRRVGLLFTGGADHQPVDPVQSDLGQVTVGSVCCVHWDLWQAVVIEKVQPVHPSDGQLVRTSTGLAIDATFVERLAIGGEHLGKRRWGCVSKKWSRWWAGLAGHIDDINDKDKSGNSWSRG